MLRARILTAAVAVAAIMFAPIAAAEDDFAVASGDMGGVGIEAGRSLVAVTGAKMGAPQGSQSASNEGHIRSSNVGGNRVVPISEEAVRCRPLLSSEDPVLDKVDGEEWCRFLVALPGTSGEQTPAMAPPTRDQVEAIALRLATRMDLPTPVPNIGPDPSVNEWNMAVVGYPLWLWVEGDATMSSQVSGYGITITLDARRTKTVFSMGDGKSVTCARMSAYSKSVKPAIPSPTCGYTYSWPSLPKGSYRVTAASSWVVDWTALGYSGSIPVTVTGERDLPVGELHSLNVAR